MSFPWRAVLFDLNGVLVDDEPLHCEMYQRALREMGITMTRREYYEKYLGFDDRGAFRAVLRDRGRRVSPARVEGLVARKAVLYAGAIRGRLRLFPGARGLVERCARRYRVAVVTGALRAEAEMLLRRGGMRPHAQVLVAAEDVRRGKPDPAGYRKALRLLNRRGGSIRAGECLVVEDSPAGIEAAHGAGMRVLGVAHTYPARELEGADWIAAGLRGLRVENLR
ncbi:MAG: HAD family phosphatase [Euryarchaeota archaeon]|nr:HAD family phosphatase [Euryarchaeota archaeon]